MLQNLVERHFPNGRIVDLSILKDGVSDSEVLRVQLEQADGSFLDLVFKCGGERVSHEAERWQLFKSCCIASKLPALIVLGKNYIVMEYIQNIGNLFQVIRQGLLAEDVIVQLFQKVLDFKEKSWTMSLQWDRPSSSSIIRTEFQETFRLLNSVSFRVSPFQVDPTIPLVVNGRNCPPLSAVLAFLHEQLTATQSRPLVPCHCDLKPENLLVVNSSAEIDFRIVDLEWAGEHDWVEALSRMGKWCSSKNIQLENVRVAIDEHRLHFGWHLVIPPLFQELQGKTEAFGQAFAASIVDLEWRKWYAVYMAAALLREILLLEKRNLNPNLTYWLVGQSASLLADHM